LIFIGDLFRVRGWFRWPGLDWREWVEGPADRVPDPPATKAHE